MGATPEWLVRAADGSDLHRKWCTTALSTYFAEPTPGRPDYSGAYFDVLGDNPPDRIVADDLVAVSLLSVEVPKHAALRFLGPDASRISQLLRRIPDDVDLHAAGVELIDHDSAAEALWTVLREHTSGGRRGDVDGAGPVPTSKLLARKRPRLLPVYDGVVGDQLGLAKPWDHWTCVHELLGLDSRFVDVLREAHRGADLPYRVSILRTLDVLLWMSDSKRCPPPDAAAA